MRSFRKPNVFAVGLLMVALVLLAARAVLAQKELPENQSSKIPASKPDESLKRTRRVSDDSRDEGPTPNHVKSPEAAQQAAAENHDSPKDEVEVLRDEIAGAPNEQERTRLRLKVANHLVATGMKREALLELQSISAENHFDPQGLYNVANAQARLGDSEGAIISYRKAIDQRKGRYSRAYNNLGVVLLRLGRWDEAYEALMSALRLEGFRYAEASYNLGRLYDARGETDLATREWRRTLAIDPKHPAAANALARQGSVGSIRVATPPERSSVIKATEKNTNPLPKDERLLSNPASAKPSTKSSTKPLRTSSAGRFSVDPETYAFLQTARNARDRSRNAEAVENYRRVIRRMDGYFAPANLELSYALISLKRNDEAIAYLLPIVQKDATRFPIAYYHLARLYELSGDLRLAEENFSRAGDAYGESNVQFLLDLTRVREKLGNFPGALAALERYLGVMERQGQKPNWADERLSALCQMMSDSAPKP